MLKRTGPIRTWTVLLPLVIGAFVVLAGSCATAAGSSDGTEVPPPGTRPRFMSTPWEDGFPDTVGTREWTSGHDGENVLVHEGVLLRGGSGWRFSPRRESDPASLVIAARHVAGSSDVMLHLLPRELGFAPEIMTEDFVRRAIRRVMAGRGAASSDLLRVEDGRPGELVYAARFVGGGQAALLIRAVPSSRGLYLATAVGQNSRDYSRAADLVRSFVMVRSGVSLRLPPGGPGFVSADPAAVWNGDSTAGPVLALPGGAVALLAAPRTELPPARQSGTALWFRDGIPEELPVYRSGSGAERAALQTRFGEAAHRLVILTRDRDALTDTLAAYILGRRTILEALQ